MSLRHQPDPNPTGILGYRLMDIHQILQMVQVLSLIATLYNQTGNNCYLVLDRVLLADH
jgi:hypothetical protein